MAKKKENKTSHFWSNTYKYRWIIPALAVLLYANTLGHKYTQDDAIVIYDNMYTTDGVSGISGLLKYDTFRGFFKTEGKAKLVSGGRYRPLTPVMFAIEYELFGKNPFVGHLINILLYAFLVLMIFYVLRRFLTFIGRQEEADLIAFIAALLFIAHPIHTEAVANIKGRDEIVAMLGAISSVWLGLRYIDTKKIQYALLAGLVFFLGLMSKENTITYLAVWPLAIFLFKRDDLKSSSLPWLMMFGGTALFLVIRTAVLGMDFGGTPMELMNNPFLKLEDGKYVTMDWGEKYATITYTLGKYLQLLSFPHPLTHDYYPRHIEMMTWADSRVLLSILAHVGLLVLAFAQYKRRPIITFGIIYYFITLSIVSNIVFPIGTNMSERFMFMPSLGFALLAGYGIFHLITKKSMSLIGMILLGLFIVGYSVKTITRNNVWKDDYTLFTTDVHTSTRSAKMLNAAGGALTTKAYSLPDGPEKTKMLTQAVTHLNKALKIHPGYKNAALILGNAYYYLGDYDKAIKGYETALYIAPEYPEAEKNLAIVLRDAGKNAGEKEGNIDKAMRYLKRSYTLNDQDIETVRLLGVASGIAQKHEDAIRYFTEVVAIQPSKSTYENLGKAYGNNGQQDKAQEMFDKAATMQN